MVDEHGMKAENRINFKDVTVLARTASCMDCLVKETIEIWLHPNNFNRDRGFPFSCSWNLATNVTKHIKEGPATSNMKSDDWLTVPHVVCTGTEHH
jgi:hypothetical protein